MFNGFMNSDDVGFIDALAVGSKYHIPIDAKSHYFFIEYSSGADIYLPTNANIGKTITFHRFLGSGAIRVTSANNNINIYSGNTILFVLNSSSVTFVYTGSYLNAFSAGVATGRDSKNGWVVVGNAMSVNPQLGNASSVVIGSGAYSSATSAVVLGVGAKATSPNAISIGNASEANMSECISIGDYAITNAINGVSIGYTSNVGHNYAIAIGSSANSLAIGDICIGYYSRGFGSGSKLALRPVSSSGIVGTSDNFSGMYMPHILSTSATPINMTTSNSVNSSTNLLGAYNNSAHACIGTIIAREGATGDSAMWEVKFLMKRGANASTTALVGTPTVTKLFNDAGAAAWTLSVAADTTNGGVYFVATGETAKTIKWSSNIQYSMVTG